MSDELDLEEDTTVAYRKSCEDGKVWRVTGLDPWLMVATGMLPTENCCPIGAMAMGEMTVN